MTPRQQSRQTGVFSVPLERIVNMNHPLCVLAGKIVWKEFDVAFGSLYHPGNGRPAKPTRLMVGLHYLKRTFDLSDEAVVARWVENPYWQYFCGMLNFTHELPIDPNLMTRWRNRIKSEGMEKLLEETIRLGIVTGVIDAKSFSKANVDTMVHEKAITYPTDAKLYHRLREKLVSAAESLGGDLRQSYRFLSPNSLFMQGRYSASRQPKRSRREVKKIKNYFGRVLRDIGRGICGRDDRPEWFTNLMELGRKAGEIFVDKGYRGHDYEGSATVHVAKRGMKKLSAALRKWMRRLAAIEPVIGHIKNDGRLGPELPERRGRRPDERDTQRLWLQHEEATEVASFFAVFRQAGCAENGSNRRQAGRAIECSGVNKGFFRDDYLSDNRQRF